MIKNTEILQRNGVEEHIPIDPEDTDVQNLVIPYYAAQLRKLYLMGREKEQKGIPKEKIFEYQEIQRYVRMLREQFQKGLLAKGIHIKNGSLAVHTITTATMNSLISTIKGEEGK